MTLSDIDGIQASVIRMENELSEERSQLAYARESYVKEMAGRDSVHLCKDEAVEFWNGHGQDARIARSIMDSFIDTSLFQEPSVTRCAMTMDGANAPYAIGIDFSIGDGREYQLERVFPENANWENTNGGKHSIRIFCRQSSCVWNTIASGWTAEEIRSRFTEYIQSVKCP